MISMSIHAPKISVIAAGVVGILASGLAPAAAQQQEIPAGWFKACTKQEEVDICNVQHIVTADTGQLVTGLSLVEVSGSVNRRVFQVTVPTGRLMPPGIGVQIDGGNTRKVDYAICFPDRCIAEVELNDDLVNAFKRGSELTVTSVNFQNQPNPIKVTLQGFTSAYDGEPLQQSDIEERQRALQEFVSRNNEDFARKLREEQDRAKAAPGAAAAEPAATE